MRERTVGGEVVPKSDRFSRQSAGGPSGGNGCGLWVSQQLLGWRVTAKEPVALTYQSPSARAPTARPRKEKIPKDANTATCSKGSL